MSKPQESPAAKFDSYNFSKLKEHQRYKKRLQGPMQQLNMTSQSWVNSRIPEMLWVILIRSKMEQREFIDFFRVLYTAWEKLKISEIWHSELANCDEKIFKIALRELCKAPKIREALLPLLLFHDLPCYDLWKSAIKRKTTNETILELAIAIEKVYDHQSQEATDCRWARLLPMILLGKIKFSADVSETGYKIANYPDIGDMRDVRPSIRAMEIGINAGNEGPWPEIFWSMCLNCSACLVPYETPEFPHYSLPKGVIGESYFQLVKNFFETMPAMVDVRREVIYGMAFYAIRLLRDISKSDNQSNLLGKVATRTLSEILINLKFLSDQDKSDLWSQYREYGVGKAKLAFLKYQESKDIPNFVNLNQLFVLANEDKWQELVDIELGDWEASNLRDRAEKSLSKTEYDKYYEWLSVYVHGHWPAINLESFTACRNPLHRYHKVPLSDARHESNVLFEVVIMVNKIFQICNNLLNIKLNILPDPEILEKPEKKTSKKPRVTK